MTGKAGIKRRLPARMATRWREVIILLFVCLTGGYIFTSCSKSEHKVENIPVPPINTPEVPPIPVIDPNADFSKFKHSNPEHARFPCALCHERKDNSATPKFSGHLPCAGCHTAQFADPKNPMCTICHTNAESGAMKSFPGLKSFNAVFDHSVHTRQTNCASCHQPSRNRAALSIPAGLNAHNSCFSCHSPGAVSGEKKIDSCDTCHQPGKLGGRSSEWVQAYEKTPFKHSSHKLNCTTCHTIRAGAGRGNQVTAPTAAMHFAPKNVQSCASCHNNKRTFGGEDFSDCRRCHRGNTFKFL